MRDVGFPRILAALILRWSKLPLDDAILRVRINDRDVVVVERPQKLRIFHECLRTDTTEFR